MGQTLVICPQCGKSVPWTPAFPWRPFCSERCRLIDLGAWLAEDHRIPAAGADDAASLIDGFPAEWDADSDSGAGPGSH